MQSQKHLFQLPANIHYLNCSYMSPSMKSVEDAGIVGIARKRNPAEIKPDDFFSDAKVACELFAELINCKASQVALIPSASYGLASAIKNIPLNNGRYAITVADEFPSDYYTVERWCKENNKELRVIKPVTVDDRAGNWNEQILRNITVETSVVVLSSVHWTDGTKFDLEKIGARCKEVNAFFIVDGAQSVGVMPIDIKKFNIDALICAGYKWLLGPYSSGLAYYGEKFNEGTPIEQSWMNMINAEDFSSLTSYSETFKEGAARYSVGEFSNFILVPMLIAAMKQIREWKIENIESYCEELIDPLVDFLMEYDFRIEKKEYRAKHMIGFSLPEKTNRQMVLEKLQERKVIVSLRGNSIRVSPHVYNSDGDVDVLIDVIRNIVR